MQSDNFHGPKLPLSDFRFSEPAGRLPKACNSLLNPRSPGHTWDLKQSMSSSVGACVLAAAKDLKRRSQPERVPG